MNKPQRSQHAEDLERCERRCLELKREFQHLECFCKGTALRRTVKRGKAYCACHDDPAKRHGPYFEWTYKAKGKTVEVKLTPETMPVYRAASKEHQKLTLLPDRMERLSQTVLRHQAKLAQSTLPQPIVKPGISSCPAFSAPPEAIRSCLTHSVYAR